MENDLVSLKSPGERCDDIMLRLVQLEAQRTQARIDYLSRLGQIAEEKRRLDRELEALTEAAHD